MQVVIPQSLGVEECCGDVGGSTTRAVPRLNDHTRNNCGLAPLTAVCGQGQWELVPRLTVGTCMWLFVWGRDYREARPSQGT